jgi:hypothetical protein
MITAHDQTDAITRIAMTVLTTQSALLNNPQRLKSAPPAETALITSVSIILCIP